MSRKANILISTRDLSYPGGTEVFIIQMLNHFLRNYSEKINFFLYETDSHAAFENKGIYRQLIKLGLRLISNGKSKISGRDLDPTKALELHEAIIRNNIILAHSFLFNSDFLLWLAIYGNKHTNQALKRIRGYKELVNILPNLRRISTTRIKNIHSKVKFISSKLNTYSIELEKKTKEWAIRKKIIDNEVEAIISRDTDKVTVVSNYGIKKWQKWTKTDPIRVPCASIGKGDLKILDPMALRRKELKAKYKVQQVSNIYLAATRLVEGKGIIELIQAFKLFLEKNHDVKLLIAGSGALEEKVKKLIKNQSGIVYLGLLGRKEIFEVNVLADYFCLFSSSEGLPLSIQEAMASKSIILATKVGGIPELVVPYKNGFLAEDNKPNTILKILNLSITLDKQKKENMKNYSRKLIEENFLREVAYEKIVKSYEGTINNERYRQN